MLRAIAKLKFASTSSSLLCIGIIFAALNSIGCSSVAGLQSAKTGDYEKLRPVIASHSFKPGEIRRLASETLSWEVRNAKDREDRVFVRSLTTCAGSLYEALNDRAETHDGVGAEAALLLVEKNRWRGAVRSYRGDEDGAWRALTARSLQGTGRERRAFFTDPDQRVRRAALLASQETADGEDLSALLEVSRLDPDPLCRSRAYQALGKLGNERTTLTLRDRFDGANEELRLSIISAWAQPTLYHQGGRHELKRVLSHGKGYAALAAAKFLRNDREINLRNQSFTRLVGFSNLGTEGERRMALTLLPRPHPETTPQLLKLAADRDEEISLLAWARLLGVPRYRAAAQIKLLDWADSTSVLAYQARAALASAGDATIVPFLERQLAHQEERTRINAGYGLLRLNAWKEMAPLLADPAPKVRRAIACRVLARPYSPTQF